jgi:branched-chain amino acid aminotransferase
MQQNFVLYNGVFQLAEEKLISHQNRAFCFGDAVFESIHCLGTLPQFIENHWARLNHGMSVLKMSPGKEFTIAFLSEMIGKLLIVFIKVREFE